MKKLIITIFCLTLANNFAIATDKIEAIKGGTKLTNELKDLYTAFYINHVIDDQNEMINLTANESNESLSKLVTDYISSNKKIKTKLNDKKLQIHLDSFLLFTVNSYTAIRNNGLKSKEFKKAYSMYNKVHIRYMTYLTTKYATNHFTKITEDNYWKNIDKNNFIQDARYKTYEEQKVSNVVLGRNTLESMIQTAQNFQEFSIYKIELADQYVKADSTNIDANDSAISIYKYILDQRKYSLYLFESWLKWRVVSQYHEHGLSKSSDIPNNLYDTIREHVGCVVLEYIIDHPDDEMAINQFLVIATHDIIRRYGSYGLGNQSTIEYHEIFYN